MKYDNKNSLYIYVETTQWELPVCAASIETVSCRRYLCPFPLKHSTDISIIITNWKSADVSQTLQNSDFLNLGVGGICPLSIGEFRVYRNSEWPVTHASLGPQHIGCECLGWL